MRLIAELIPAAERAELLELNVIANAKGIADDQNMHHLMVIWRTYIETDIGNCPLCVNRVLKNFRELQSTLIQLEKESKLLG